MASDCSGTIRSFSSMAGRSLPAGPSPPDVVDILRKLRSVGFCSALEVPSHEPGTPGSEKPSLLFDRVLSVFLAEIYHRGEMRPMPAMLGDGRPVDLFRLYSVVREKGGYDLVTACRAWAPVAEAVGLESSIGSSLKLIYAKYLGALERWFERVLEKVTGDHIGWKNGVGKLETKVKGSASETVDQKKKGQPSTLPSCLKKGHLLTPGNGKNQSNGLRNGHSVVAWKSKRLSLKRKREAVVGMLNWVKNLAKKPINNCNSLKLVLSNGSQTKSNAIDEYFQMALVARQMMLLKRNCNADPYNSVVQNGHNTSSFCGCTNSGSTQIEENARCSLRLRSVMEQPNSAFCLELDDESIDRVPMATGEESSNGEQRPQNCGVFLNSWLSKDQQRMQIPVGHRFQVDVPDWTGEPSETFNDPDALKWLGTRMWLPQNQEKSVPFTDDSIGKGRQDNCECEHTSSVECIRFHIAEKRVQLKRELGSAFYAWGFNCMGEEVALSWTGEEEQQFKDIVRLNPPSLNKNYWDHLYPRFPSKSAKSLVSYYFNVFLLGRRRYQNRVTPNNIDSDDEETEFGLICNPLGYDAIKLCNYKPITCILNKQCMDLDC